MDSMVTCIIYIQHQVQLLLHHSVPVQLALKTQALQEYHVPLLGVKIVVTIADLLLRRLLRRDAQSLSDGMCSYNFQLAQDMEP